MNVIRRHFASPAMIVACAALTVALGGVSYAAGVLPKNSVGTAQLQKNAVSRAKLKRDAVTGAKVKNGSLMAADFKAGQLRTGPQGPAGPQGPKGDPGPQGPAGQAGQPGAPATKLFGAIAWDGSLLHGSGVTASKNTSPGSYIVTFDRSLASCVATANYYQDKDTGVGYNAANHFALSRVYQHADQLSVYNYNTALSQSFNVPFSIIAIC